MSDRQIAIHHFPFPLGHTGLSMDMPVFQLFSQIDDDVVFDWRQPVARLADHLAELVAEYDAPVLVYLTAESSLVHQAMMEAT